MRAPARRRAPCGCEPATIGIRGGHGPPRSHKRRALSRARRYIVSALRTRRTDELTRFGSDLPHLDLSLRSTARRVRATAAACSRCSSSPSAWSLGRSRTTAGMSDAGGDRGTRPRSPYFERPLDCTGVPRSPVRAHIGRQDLTNVLREPLSDQHFWRH